jgi:hypothetical protein
MFVRGCKERRRRWWRRTSRAVFVAGLILAGGAVLAQAAGWEPLQSSATATQGTAAVVERSWTVKGDDGNVLGVLHTLVRCGETLYVTDVRSQRILRLNAKTGVQEPGFTVPMPPFSFGADCATHRLFAAGGSSRRMVLLELDARTGAQLREYPLPTTLFPQGGLHVDGDQVVVGGVRLSSTTGSDVRLGDATIDGFYRDKTIAITVARESGAVAAAFAPFDMTCPAGAGMCMRATFTSNPAAGGGWIVTQPASAAVGVYDGRKTLVRRVDIGSALFRRTGGTIPIGSAAEAELRWGADNSQVFRAYAFPDGTLAVVHYRIELPKGWSFGLPVQFQAWMNVYDASGRALASDVRLPELPIGQDDRAIYVADYGPDRRQGAYESVHILQIAVPRK